ncbi:hypothetical protein EB796_019359 [Bugula neritina]|uniref:Carboxylesterase type B domain-containing protein n=1 Tax=Bugula neritina TaxID=10212 RepID=A0A7J7J7Z8_BUGNE|nr:hypothetical protein EB796_019359 [Bugula neritina]
MYKARYIVTLSFLLWHTAAGADPVVQLSHGGQLKGKSLTYNNTDVAIFLGIPYAEAPVGKLRFKKPEAYPS